MFLHIADQNSILYNNDTNYAIVSPPVKRPCPNREAVWHDGQHMVRREGPRTLGPDLRFRGEIRWEICPKCKGLGYVLIEPVTY